MTKGFEISVHSGERLMNKNEKEYGVVLDRRLAEKTFLLRCLQKCVGFSKIVA